MSVDNDRYRINGTLRQVMLSARELNSASLPNRTWVNERLTFTHGYGLTLGPVNQVTSEGLPVLFVRDLPPQSTVDLKIDEPSIYFGELTNDYVIVRTETREFNYPRGDDNEFTQYAGTGGVALGSLWRKLIFALRFGSYQISSATTSVRRAGSSSTATSASASRRWRRSCASSIRIRIWSSPMDDSSGFMTRYTQRFYPIRLHPGR